VDVGAGEPLQIVCGAPNARKDLRVAVATVGTVLPGDFAIKAARVRDVDSFGMLCSRKELGMAETVRRYLLQCGADALRS
jgi:phenylalanyl-tRNA synthetase beta chain